MSTSRRYHRPLSRTEVVCLCLVLASLVGLTLFTFALGAFCVLACGQFIKGAVCYAGGALFGYLTRGLGREIVNALRS